jgi:hypothetical protein
LICYNHAVAKIGGAYRFAFPFTHRPTKEARHAQIDSVAAGRVAGGMFFSCAIAGSAQGKRADGERVGGHARTYDGG